MHLVNECISILIRSMAQDNTWVGVVASSTHSSVFLTARASWIFRWCYRYRSTWVLSIPIHLILMLSTPIHRSAIDVNPFYLNWSVAARIVTCNGSSQVLNFEAYSQRGSFEFRLFVLLVASALSRWFFSVVITSNSILSVVALNFDFLSFLLPLHYQGGFSAWLLLKTQFSAW